MVKNRCLDKLRIEKTHQLHHEKIKNTASEIIEEDDKDILQIERLVRLHNAINSLPEQNRFIFKLSRFEGKTNQEIADQLQLSKRTVETHISNALKKIKSMALIVFIVLIYSLLYNQL